MDGPPLPRGATKVTTIDLTPSWSGLLPLYLTAYAEGTPTAQSAARTELERMARLADAYVAQQQHPTMDHAANEWADAFYAARQWIKNLRDGIGNYDTALTNLEDCALHCQEVWKQARKESD